MTVSHVICEQCPARKQSVFAHLDREALRTVSANKILKMYRPKDIIYHEGTPASYLLCLWKGQAGLLRYGATGKYIMTYLAGPGDILGFASLLEKNLYLETAKSLSPTMTCLIPKDIFAGFLDKDSTVRHLFKALLITRMNQQEDRLLEMCEKSCEQRMAGFLVQFQTRFQGNGSSSELPFFLSREDLAGLLGMSTETAIRILTDFQKKGYLNLSSRKLNLLQHEKLASIYER